MLKRIAVEIDGGLPTGDAWHRQLIDRMAKPTDLRPAVLSQDLYDILSEYLAFRHVFRSSYSFHLEWEKMSSLVLNCESTMRRLEGELQVNEAFLPAKTGGLTLDSVALCYQIRTLDKRRLTRNFGRINDEGVKQSVFDALRFQLGM